MKTNIQHIVRISALCLVLLVSLTVGATFASMHRSSVVSVFADTWSHSQVLLAGGDGGQETHGGGKGGGSGSGGGGGHSHG